MVGAGTSGLQALCQRGEQSRHLARDARAGAGRVEAVGVGPLRCQTGACVLVGERIKGMRWLRASGNGVYVAPQRVNCVQLDDAADVHQHQEWGGPRPRAAHGHNLRPGRNLQYGNVKHLATGIGTELFGLQHEAAEAEAVDPARAGGAFAVLEGNGALKRVAAVTSRGCPEFCVRSINMTNRIIYAKQNEVEERSHCRPKRGAA